MKGNNDAEMDQRPPMQPTLQNLLIVRAEERDLSAIIDLMEEAATWLSTFDIKQWPVGLVRNNPSIILRRIAEHEVYLGRLEGELAATMTIQWTDPAVWGRMDDRAGYVHGLVTARRFAGRGLGRRMLEYAEERIRAENGTLIRLDCVAANPRLRRYYTESGFTFLREKQMSGDDWRALFEKKLDPPVGPSR